MPAREKSDIVSGGFTGMNILKALRDGGATDEDLRRIISTPTVRDGVVRLLKDGSPQLAEMIFSGAKTFATAVRLIAESALTFRIGVHVDHGTDRDHDRLNDLVDRMEALELPVRISSQERGSGNFTHSFWIVG